MRTRIAQVVERRARNPDILGSNPGQVRIFLLRSDNYHHQFQSLCLQRLTFPLGLKSITRNAVIFHSINVFQSIFLKLINEFAMTAFLLPNKVQSA